MYFRIWGQCQNLYLIHYAGFSSDKNDSVDALEYHLAAILTLLTLYAEFSDTLIRLRSGGVTWKRGCYWRWTQPWARQKCNERLTI
jgi:hypothetical protein